MGAGGEKVLLFRIMHIYAAINRQNAWKNGKGPPLIKLWGCRRGCACVPQTDLWLVHCNKFRICFYSATFIWIIADTVYFVKKKKRSWIRQFSVALFKTALPKRWKSHCRRKHEEIEVTNNTMGIIMVLFHPIKLYVVSSSADSHA